MVLIVSAEVGSGLTDAVPVRALDCRISDGVR